MSLHNCAKRQNDSIWSLYFFCFNLVPIFVKMKQCCPSLYWDSI